MNGHEAGHLLSAYLDGALGPEEQARVDAHLASCGACRGELEGLRKTKGMLASARRRDMPPDLFEALQAKAGRAEGRIAPWLWARRPQAWIPVGAAALATLLLGIWFGWGPGEEDIPLEPLVAAHSRYSAEALIPHGDLVASNFSAQLALYNGEE